MASVNDNEFITYFQSATDFLHNMRWIHDFHVTDMLGDEVLNRVNKQWLQAMAGLSCHQLNQLPYLDADSLTSLGVQNLPKDLLKYFQAAQSLSLPRELSCQCPPACVDRDLQRGMSPKKLHEVCRIAPLVHRAAQKTGCRVVLDIGSGLGYLGQVLHRNYGYSVIGVEGHEGHNSRAEVRLSKQASPCQGIQTVQFRLEDSPEKHREFRTILQQCLTSIQPCPHSRVTERSSTKVTERSSAKVTERSTAKVTNADVKVSGRSRSSDPDPDQCQIPDTDHMKKGCCCAQKRGGDIQVCMDLTEDLSASEADKEMHGGIQSKQHASENYETNPSASCDPRMCKTCGGRVNIFEGLHASSLTSGTNLNPAQSKHSVDTDAEHVGSSSMQEPLSACSSCVNFWKRMSAENVDPHLRRENSVVTHEEKSDHSLSSSELSPLLSPPSSSSPRFPKNTPSQTSSTSISSPQLTSPAPKPSPLPLSSTSPKSSSSSSSSSTAALQGKTTPHRVCLIGLHCCGDLSPLVLRAFQELEEVKAVCLVSCCYHKMFFSDDMRTFACFPLSQTCSQALSGCHGDSSGSALLPCSLRLAAQETRSRWRQQTEEEHADHWRHVAYRSLLQQLPDADRELERLGRKAVRKACFSSFPAFLASLHPDPTEREREEDEVERELQRLHAKLEPCFPLIEPLTCLQVAMQPVLESLVTTDRLCWLREHGFQASILPVFDENISPRNLALVAVKSSTEDLTTTPTTD